MYLLVCEEWAKGEGRLYVYSFNLEKLIVGPQREMSGDFVTIEQDVR